MVKKLFKIFLWFSGISLILITAFFIFIQTDIFNKLALDYAVDKINESFGENDGKVQVSSVSGNILTGLTLDSGYIFVKRDTLLEFNYIKLKYNLWGLLDHQILLDNIIINSPRINIEKIKDSTETIIWNFSKLFRSSAEEDTTGSPFDWDIAVGRLKIENGLFETENKFIDTVNITQPQNPDRKEFNFDNLIVSDLNLELEAGYFKDSKSIDLKHLSFKSNTGFGLKRFNFYAGINAIDPFTEIKDLEIETNLSKIKINRLTINKFNPFDSTTFKDFGEKDFEADLNIEQLNFRDVRFFVPEAGMLDSSLSLEVIAKGKYGDFNLSNLQLNLPDSRININGTVRNLDEPENLYLDVSAEDLDILAKDINTIYKDPAFPDLSRIGKINAGIQFTGTLENFYSGYDIRSDAGSAGGHINLNLKDKSYSGQVNTNHLDIGKILNDRSLESNLNLFADFSGTGFDPDHMNASAKYIISSSSLMNYDVRHSAGTLKFYNKNVSMNLRYSSSIGNASVVGKVNIANPRNPVYVLNGRVSSLNLAALTNNSDDQSDLNFSFDINGRGSSLNNISGKFKFDIGNSLYGENHIPKTPLDIEIDNSAGYSSYSISSDMLDLSAKGNFRLEAVSNIIIDNLKLISGTITSKLIPDSNSNQPDYYRRHDLGIYSNENFTLDYALTLKDSASFNSLMYPFGIIFNGSMKGSISNGHGGFSLISDLDVRNFAYRDTAIILKNFNSDISIVNNYELLSEEDSLSSLDINLTANGDEIAFQNSVFDSVKVNFELLRSAADLNIQGRQDSALSAYVNGKIDLANTILTATFDSVNVKYNDIVANNENEWIINYEPGQKISFEQFAVKSRNIQLNVDGDYVFDGTSNLNLSGKDIKLGDLYSVIYPADESKILVKQKYPIRGSINKLNIHFKGDAENPELSADISTGQLKLNTEEGTDVGDLSLKIDYKDESAETDMVFKNAENKGSLRIKGNIPYRNPLSNDTLTGTDFSGKSVDLKLTSKDFQLKYFLKLLPSLPDIGGKMNGEITATGNASSPDLKGSIAINDGDFYLGLTGMNYKYKLKTSTENSKLVINNLSVSSSSDEARHFDIFGNIDFSGMRINDIDLSSSGDMVFLDKDVTQNEFGVYGYFRAGSGSPPIQIKGNPDKLSITGELLITDATISSVPLGGSGYDNKVDNFTYVLISDSSDNYVKDTAVITEASEYYKINPFARYKYTVSENQKSVADFLDMDINVKTQRNIYVSIDFDNITKDRLFGEITADLNLKTEDKEFKATGDVNILKNSYYRFYKDFKLKDSKISFDGPISNPILDIRAVYEGTKTTEQFGSVSSTPVQVKLTIEGNLDKPKIELKLIEDGTEVSGNDAQADAITFLLFGKYKSELSTSERKSVASSLGTSVGSLYISSIVSQTVRNILPFLIDAQFNYTEGNITDTDVELTSELGDATITVGGKLLKEIRNFEFVIEYPLNDFLNLNLPETLLIQLSREEEDNIVFGSSETTTNTGIKILYKITN